MIGFLRGKVHYFDSEVVLLDVNGVGYRINYGHPELLKVNEEVLIYTYQNVSENDMSLFGFKSLDEYNLFLKLISVKGIGPKMASGMISKTSYERIIEAIENEDTAFIKSLPGIGNKTASQIILDLRGKLTANESKEVSQELNDVIDALKALGYKQAEIKNVINKIGKVDLSVDEYIKKALGLLVK